jgi:putative tRNA adenosine deaminase-associated protein
MMSSGVYNEDDFGLIAWHEDSRWNVSRLVETRDLSSIIDQLKAQQTDGGAIVLISVDQEFFIIARARGAHMNMMLSDVTYANEYEVAADLIDTLDLPFPEEEDEPQPGGDIDLLADLGISGMELEVMSDDLDLYPEDQISALASRLGFADQFDEIYDRD